MIKHLKYLGTGIALVVVSFGIGIGIANLIEFLAEYYDYVLWGILILIGCYLLGKLCWWGGGK
jgi:putative Mn2+ efflux pump MntP